MNDEKNSEESTEITLGAAIFYTHPLFVLIILAIVFVLCYFSDYIDCKTLVIALAILALADALYIAILYFADIVLIIAQKTQK